jgi:hypothetical protein
MPGERPSLESVAVFDATADQLVNKVEKLNKATEENMLAKLKN